MGDSNEPFTNVTVKEWVAKMLYISSSEGINFYISSFFRPLFRISYLNFLCMFRTGATDFNITLNGCNECESVDSCIDNLHLHAALVHILTYLMSNMWYRYCACSSFASSLSSSFTNDINSCNLWRYDQECAAEVIVL